MSDPLDLVRDLAPAGEHRPELLERVRNDLMATIDDTTPRTDPRSAPTPASRRMRRRWLIPAATAVVLTTAAGTWALTQTSDNSTVVECPDNTIIDSVTGDPITDCANEWRRSNGTQPPVMVAYDNGNGGVSVLLATDPVPDGYTELDPGPYQNAGLIQLQDSLEDVEGGLPSGCYDEPAARDIVRDALDQLGFADWAVTVDETRRPDGDSLCAYFVIDPADRHVELIGVDTTTPQSNPYEPYAAALASKLEASCLNLDDAATLARSLAADAVIEVDGTRIDLTEQAGVLVVHEVEDAVAACTSSTVSVTGRVDVTLRGPRN